jgi:hypothetical protein
MQESIHLRLPQLDQLVEVYGSDELPSKSHIYLPFASKPKNIEEERNLVSNIVTLPLQSSTETNGSNWTLTDIYRLYETRAECSWIKIWTQETKEPEGDGPYTIHELITGKEAMMDANDAGGVVLRLESHESKEREIALRSVQKLIILPWDYKPPAGKSWPTSWTLPSHGMPPGEAVEFLISQEPLLQGFRTLLRALLDNFGSCEVLREKKVLELGCAGQVSLFRFLRDIGVDIQGVAKARSDNYGEDLGLRRNLWVTSSRSAA